MIGDGVVKDQAESAKFGRESRAGISRIMDLELLAPVMQESLMFLPNVKYGDDPVHERQIRAVLAEPNWIRQKHLWNRLRESYPAQDHR